MRPEIIQVSKTEFFPNNTVVPVMCCLMDVIYQEPRSLFNSVTGRASMVTVQSKSGHAMLARYSLF